MTDLVQIDEQERQRHSLADGRNQGAEQQATGLRPGRQRLAKYVNSSWRWGPTLLPTVWTQALTTCEQSPWTRRLRPMLLTTPGRVSQLHAAVDPLRRVRVPRDLTSLVSVSRRRSRTDPLAVGMSAERDRGDLARQLSGALSQPACTRRSGSACTGTARSCSTALSAGLAASGLGESGLRVAATPQTPYCIYSASKAVTATVVHLLHERGLLDINARVAEYLTEFNRPIFEDITVDHVLSHRAGIPFVPRSFMDLDRFTDPAFISRSRLTSVRLRNAGRAPGAVVSRHLRRVRARRDRPRSHRH